MCVSNFDSVWMDRRIVASGESWVGEIDYREAMGGRRKVIGDGRRYIGRKFHPSVERGAFTFWGARESRNRF